MSSWSFFESVMLSLHLPILEWFGNKNGSNRKVWEFQLLYMILFSCCLKLKGGLFVFFSSSHMVHAFFSIPFFLFANETTILLGLSFVLNCSTCDAGFPLTAVTVIWEAMFITSDRKIIWKCAFWWYPSSLRSHFWLKVRHWCYSLNWKMTCFPLILK